MSQATADLLQRYMIAFTDDHDRAARDFYTEGIVLRIKGAAFAAGFAMVHVLMSASRRRRSAAWERSIVYRLTGQRIDEIVFFEFDIRTLEGLLQSER